AANGQIHAARTARQQTGPRRIAGIENHGARRERAAKGRCGSLEIDEIDAAGNVLKIFFAKAGIVANFVEQVALDAGERLQGDRLAAAAQKRLHQVEVHGGNARQIPAAAQIDDGAVGEREEHQGAGGKQLGETRGGADLPRIAFAGGLVDAGVFANRLLQSKELECEGETLLRDRQRRQIQVLALGLKLTTVDEAQFDSLFERDQEWPILLNQARRRQLIEWLSIVS